MNKLKKGDKITINPTMNLSGELKRNMRICDFQKTDIMTVESISSDGDWVRIVDIPDGYHYSYFILVNMAALPEDLFTI